MKKFSDEGFTLREEFKSPMFMPIVLDDPYTHWVYTGNLTRHSITDIGICETVNSYSMKATYKVIKSSNCAQFP